MPPKYVVMFQNSYLKVQNNCIVWTRKEDANKYDSKYAAKRHLKNMGVTVTYQIEECKNDGK